MRQPLLPGSVHALNQLLQLHGKSLQGMHPADEFEAFKALVEDGKGVEDVAARFGVSPLCAVGRLHRALWVNHRYWFTTWRWSQVLGALLLMGAVMRLALLA
jgi:hypothetical protein